MLWIPPEFVFNQRALHDDLVDGPQGLPGLRLHHDFIPQAVHAEASFLEAQEMHEGFVPIEYPGPASENLLPIKPDKPNGFIPHYMKHLAGSLMREGLQQVRHRKELEGAFHEWPWPLARFPHFSVRPSVLRHGITPLSG